MAYTGRLSPNGVHIRLQVYESLRLVFTSDGVGVGVGVVSGVVRALMN